jgi:hypothetical protein
MQVGDGDTYLPQGRTEGNYPVRFRTTSMEHRIGNDFDAKSSSLPNALPLAVLDLIDAAATVYTADLAVPRSTAFDEWTRDLTLHLALRDPTPWQNGAGETFRQLIAFLTGDAWHDLVIRAAPVENPIPKNKQLLQHFEDVSLFSGGLDSYAGVVDLLKMRGRCALVGHHARGGPTLGSQNAVLKVIRTKYTVEETPFLDYFVAPPVGISASGEATTRGRSIIFLALGVATALGVGATRLFVPENGFISLNVPMASSRLGSLSTRTTHPYTMALMRKLLDQLGISLEIVLPYRFKTKGELLSVNPDQVLLKQGINATLSCGHPSVSMRSKKVPEHLRKPNTHCGYCVPCLIRRAAIESAYGVDAPIYAYDNITALGGQSGRDVRVVRFALKRAERSVPTLADVLTAGPLPGSTDDLINYREVHLRGLGEMRSFLAKRGL